MIPANLDAQQTPGLSQWTPGLSAKSHRACVIHLHGKTETPGSHHGRAPRCHFHVRPTRKGTFPHLFCPQDHSKHQTQCEPPYVESSCPGACLGAGKAIGKTVAPQHAVHRVGPWAVHHALAQAVGCWAGARGLAATSGGLRECEPGMCAIIKQHLETVAFHCHLRCAQEQTLSWVVVTFLPASDKPPSPSICGRL